MTLPPWKQIKRGSIEASSSSPSHRVPGASAPGDSVEDLPTRAKARTIGIVRLVIFVVFAYIVVAQLSGLSAAVKRLSEVEPLLLLLGLLFQASALLCYSQLTASALTPEKMRLTTLFRIQLATKAVTNVVPGGSAAGSALGYRLLTFLRIDSTTAGLALATSGIGSAVVLNLLLWATLLVSIPLSGLNPVYVTTALVGVLLLFVFLGLVVAVIRGADQAERVLYRLSKRFTSLNPERANAVVRRSATRVRELVANRRLLLRLVIWAVLNWVLDAVSLWMFLRAFGVSLRPDSLLVAFCVANVSAAIPITPGGLGVIDLTLTSMLAFFGVGSVAGLAVPAYRLASYWLPIPIGGLAYFTLRVGPWSIDRMHELASLRSEADRVVKSGESVYDWADRVTAARVTAAAEAASASGDVVILADRATPGTVRVPATHRPPGTAPDPGSSSPPKPSVDPDNQDWVKRQVAR